MDNNEKGTHTALSAVVREEYRVVSLCSPGLYVESKQGTSLPRSQYETFPSSVNIGFYERPDRPIKLSKSPPPRKNLILLILAAASAWFSFFFFFDATFSIPS